MTDRDTVVAFMARMPSTDQKIKDLNRAIYEKQSQLARLRFDRDRLESTSNRREITQN